MIPKSSSSFRRILLVFLVVGTFSGLYQQAAASSERPNIILVMTDDQGWGETGYYNHPVLRTPHLDAMASNGLRMDRFYTASSVCSPTRASVLTGRAPSRAAVYNHGWPLRHQEKTLAQALKAAGYKTGHFGKWHLNGIRGPGVPVLADDSHSPGAFGFDEWLTVTNFFDMNPLMSRKGVFEEFSGDSSKVIVSEALNFIRDCKRANQPFLAVIWDGSPHLPFVASEADRSHFPDLDLESQHHYGELVAFDRSLGVLRKALRRMGIEDNTILWFCSDNGGLDNVTPETVGGLRGHKGTLWEGGIRVPAILEWPGRIQPRSTRYPVSTTDIFPTIADIVDLEESSFVQPVDGRSVVELFDSEIERRGEPVAILHDNRGALIDNQYKLLSTDLQKGEFQLYNLEQDPTESHNIAESEQQRFNAMRQQFNAWHLSVQESIAGRDYAGHKVLPGDPERHFWSDDERYRPFFEEWMERQEYKGFLQEGAK